MKMIYGCLLAIVLLSCLTDAQLTKKQPQSPNYPPVAPQTVQHTKNPQDSGFHSCDVASNIRVTCGAPGISASDCEAISCCFDGHTCYYGAGGKYLSISHSTAWTSWSEIWRWVMSMFKECSMNTFLCYFSYSVTLQCTKDAQIILVVARFATTPNIDLETISFLGHDSSCNAVDSNSGFAIFQFPVTACGTSQRVRAATHLTV